MEPLQYFNIRLFSLSLSVAQSLGLSVSGFSGSSDTTVNQNLLFLEITARNSVWKPTTDAKGVLAHVTVQGLGLVVSIISSNVSVDATASFSSILASTVSVSKAKAQYTVDSTKLPESVNDLIFSGLTLAGPMSFDALGKIGKAVNERWPELIREDPTSLRFRDMQLYPPKPRTTVDKIKRARGVTEVARELAGGKTLEEARAKFAALREQTGASEPSDVLAESVYAWFKVGAGDPEETGASDRAREWLRLYS